MKEIRGQIDKTTSDYNREKLQERLAKLVGGVALLRCVPAIDKLKLEGDEQVGANMVKLNPANRILRTLARDATRVQTSPAPLVAQHP